MSMRYQYQHNAADKEERIERAREIAEACKYYDTHEEWKKASSAMAELMEEWRIMDQNADGFWTRRRNHDENEALWDLFSGERSYFFGQRDAWYEAKRQEKQERDRLQQSRRQQKEDLIKRALDVASATDAFEANRKLEELFAAWKAVGSTGRSENDLWQRFFAIKSEVKERRNALKAAREGSKRLEGAKREMTPLAQASARTPIHSNAPRSGFMNFSERANAPIKNVGPTQEERDKREIIYLMQQLASKDDLKPLIREAQGLRQRWISIRKELSRELEANLYAQFKEQEDIFWKKFRASCPPPQL